MSPKYTCSDDDIIIRDFELKDLDRVKYLFRIGMQGHVPTLIKLLTWHRLTTPSLTHPLVLSAPITSILGWMMPPFLSKERTTSTGITSLTMYLGATLLSSLGWLGYHTYLSHKLFAEYIQYSIDSDISDIPSIYQAQGGVFLVATNKESDLVIGMVGGEKKDQEIVGDDGIMRDVYEIRRMSIGPEARGKGLGSQLLHSLQDRIPKSSRLFADCTNIQPAAQRLYRRCGFELTRTFGLESWPHPFQIWRFEKAKSSP